MIINCPNAGNLELDKCRHCKKNRILNCPFTGTYINIVTREALKEHKFPSTTSLLGCNRATYFNQTHDYLVNLDNSRYIFRGYVYHKGFENYIDAETELELKIALDDTHIINGRCDYYSDGTVKDYKTINEIIPKFLPKTEHIYQVSLYALGLEQLGKEVKEAIIEYYDSNMNMLEVRLTYDQLPIEQAIRIAKSSLNTINSALKTNTPPPVCDKSDQWRCNYCNAKEDCQLNLLEAK